ncbi:DUF1542 domain-containing protein [Limosilactobacillus sp. RRLNB_1_1]|uniref:DUF1542 domain-containing protein n=1 Tax=Limosilactobacillus albertensis TaxID=2759752 RepID=A0A7W3Y9G3_9LACO|nr:DUF1542 domain-containing protein [Limosilactobacillus albertensis]MBB1070452.1 DUF1542 domain-containing protein [Limosilactobacillus albertensis]MCD7117494.1 DUF1542 domain-containing protein [Limosilactobacillus albertensis]MCD7127842.1 DUF1542 domain-containing protein [Limosilactobacillus albertensis]
MVSKNNHKLIAEKNRKNEKQRFALRKLNVGVASVLLGVTFSVYGGGQLVAHADTTTTSDQPEEAKTTNKQSLADQSQVTLNNNAQTDNSVTASETNKSATNQQPVGGVATKSTDATDTPATTTNNEKVTANEATVQKTTSASQGQSTNADQNQNSLDGTRQVLQNISNTASYRNNTNNVASLFGASFVATPTSEATTDNNSVTVSDAKGLIDAIQNGTATTINVANDINLGSVIDSEYKYVTPIKNRDFTIQSATPGTTHTIDFSGYCFNMSSQNSVTFKDLNIYSRTYWGVVYNAGGYTFDNVDFTGSQLVYTKPSINSTVTFKNAVNATAVGSYTGPLDGKTRSSQGGNTQQILQFEGGNNKIIFDEGSNVNLTTTNSNVLEIDGGTTNIEVKKGANVSLNPHSKGNPEHLNGMDMGKVARAIASKGTTNLTIDNGSNLNINLNKASDDNDLSGALYLNSGATINVNGNLNIDSDGQSSFSAGASYVPVYVNGTAAINVNGGNFKVTATNMGDNYTGPIVSLNGKSTIAINHHGTFDVTGDGTQATGVSLGSGSTFTSTQPELFNISMPDGATAIKNGKVQFKGVKTSADGQPIGKIDITYASDGTPTVTKVTSYDEQTVIDTREAGNKAKNKINLVAAGEEVNLSNVSFVKNADGTYTMSGNANTADNKGAYVYVSVNGTVHQVAPTDSQTLWTAGETGDPTSSHVPYTAETGTDGKFTVNLGKLKDTDQVSVYGAKDFVTSDTDTKTVSEWMTSSYRDQLQKLVDEAPTVEAGSNYINATDNLKTAYTNAINAGKTTLQNSSATSEQLESVAKQITDAKAALNGDLNKVKQDLQAAVDAAPDFENTSATYYNANLAKQKAYRDAISAGSDALKAQNPTVESLTDALNKINNAKTALDGQPTNKQALHDAVDESKDVKNSNNYTNADQAAKTAYDDAVTTAQSILDKNNATQDQVDQALQNLTRANGNLNGDAKTEATNKQALETAVKDAPNVRNTPAYYNGDSKDQDAYNKAITDGQAVLDKSNATPAEVKNALDAITNAKKTLDGQPTNKDALQDAVNKSKGIKDSNNYANADQNEKTAYDNAVTAAQSVLDNPNATQAQVDQALQNLTRANGNLNGDAKTEAANRVALEAAVKEAPTVEKTSSKYYNGTEKAQDDYKNAVSEGQKVLDNANATADQIKTALDNINAAKGALDGDPTDKTTLQNSVDNAVDLDKSNADVQAKKDYTDALDKAKQVLADPNATQQAVDEANTALTNAKTALDNSAALQNAKDALQKAVDAKVTTEKTPAYYNADSAKQQAYNTAISAGTDALNAQNPTVESLTKALNKINDAKNALDGKATDTSKLKAAVDNADTVKAGNDYKDASADVQKQYDDAVKAGQQLLDPTTAPSPLTQADVDRAAKAITDEQNALTTSATTNVKDAKEKATADLATAVDTAKKAIDQDSNLTEDERNAAKAQVDQDASAAKEAVNKATTNDAVTSAATAGKVAIDKTVANAAIDNAAAGKNKAIDGSSLTDEEKNGIKDQVAQAVKNAKEAISAADTEQAVKTAQETGVGTINKISVPAESTVKQAAKDAVAKAVEAKNQAIDASNLTDEEKAVLKQEVTTAQNAADTAIDNAKNDAAVATAQEDGVKSIEGIVVPAESAAKTAAKEAVKKVADAKNAAIDASSLTAEEKAALKQKVTDAQTAADTAIDAATTNNDVTKEQDTGIANINKIAVPTASDAKTKAITDLNNAVDAAKKAIDQDTNLTAEEKQAAKDQVDADAKTAQEAVNKATTNDGVTTAANNGKVAIDKTVANAAIDNAVAGKKAEISNAKDLSTDDANALNNEVDQAANDAKNAISSANTEKAVKTAQDAGVDKINAIDVATTAAKDKAKSDIDQAANDAKKAIDDNKDLTDDQKTAAKDQIDQAATKAKDNINNAKTDKAAEDANNAGQLVIAKDGAKAAIQGALNKKLNEIDSASALTSDEKAKLINDANTAATNANKAIDAATTLTGVTSAQTAGIQDIENVKVPTESATKTAADKAIDTALANKQAEINKSTTLTDEEKANLNEQATDAANTAKQNIANAKTDSDVATAQDNGVAAIDGIKVPANSTAKDKAKSNITNAADKAKQAIDQDNNLTNDQKQAAKDQIDTDAKNAQDAIDNAKTDADVNNAADNGKLAIDKTVADAAIDNAVAGKIKDVKAPLTTDEQKTLTDLIKETGENAKQNIANAATPAEVTTAQNNGVKAIKDIKVPTTSSVKDNATSAIDKALQNKTNEINNATNITDQEKQDLIKQATDAANTAKDKINNATTNSDVATAETNGEKAIADVTIPGLSDIKKESTDLINKALDKKKDEINNASNLSNDEKQQLINDATKAATDAINKVNNAKTNDEAKAAADTGVQNIENISIPSLDNAKKNANQAIDDALNAKTDEINNASNLSDQEKQDLINKATDAANTAKDNINSATTNDAVKKAEEDGVNSIKGVNFTNLDDAKKAANNAIDNALTNKTNEINNASNLSQDEKQDLINKATDAANTAKDNINKATTNDAVTDAQNKGIEGIANVTVPGLDEAKQNAINAIKQVQEAKNKQINDAKNLNADQQKSLTDQVNKIANDAIAQINDSSVTTNDSVATIRDNAIDQITNLFIPTLDGAQDDATNAIETAKNAKIDEINNAKNLSDQEKQDLTDQVNKAADDATKAIKNATTNDAVKNAETKGLNDINNITVPSLAEKQQAAIQELSQVRDAKLAAIDNASILTTDEKDSLKDQVQGKYSQATANITQATTDDAVTTAKEAGIEAINNVVVPDKSAAKQAAKDAVAKAAEAKDAAIDKSSLTDEEKAALKQQVTDAQEAANKAIDNAATNAEVTNAQNEGTKSIDGIEIPSNSAVKDKAIAAIDSALKKKTDEINNATNISADEKQQLINDATNAATEAINNINNAKTNDDAQAAANTGVQNIENVKVPSLADAKNNANQAIDDALNAKKAEINGAANLSDTEKTSLIAKATDAANTAKDNIAKATTNDAVTEAQNKGIQAIAGVTVPSLAETKQAAINAIKQAQEAKNQQISGAKNLSAAEQKALTDQVDKIADDAIAKINDSATTNDAVTATRDSAIKQINDLLIPTISTAREQAKVEITKDAEAAKQDIDKDTNLTADEKQTAKDQIDADAKNAQNTIDNAATDSDVNKAVNDGQLTIAKDVANAAIDNAVAGKKAEIANAPLTNTEKQALNDRVDQAAQTAKNNIAQATTTGEVANAQENGVKAINGIEVPTVSAVKNKAQSNLTSVVNTAKEAIDQDTNLTDAQKQVFKDQIDTDAKNAQEAINNAKTDTDVNNAIDNGKLAIAKDVANAAIANAVAGKKAEIAASELTDVQKTALNNQVDGLAQQAQEAIKQATTESAVTTAMEQGIVEINRVEIPAADNQSSSNSTDNGATNSSNTTDNANKNDETQANTTDVTQTANQANGQQAEHQATAIVSSEQQPTSQKSDANKKAELPQTGNDANNLSVAGLAVVSLMGLFGLKKRSRKDN